MNVSADRRRPTNDRHSDLLDGNLNAPYALTTRAVSSTGQPVFCPKGQWCDLGAVGLRSRATALRVRNLPFADYAAQVFILAS